MEKDKLIKMLIGFFPLLLLFLDPPEGMDPKAWGLFPFYAGAILMVMLRPVGEATALAIFLGLYAVIMRGHTVALSGFALTMTWLVVGAYIIARPGLPRHQPRQAHFLLDDPHLRTFYFGSWVCGSLCRFHHRSCNAVQCGAHRRHHLSHLPQRRGIFGFVS